LRPSLVESILSAFLWNVDEALLDAPKNISSGSHCRNQYQTRLGASPGRVRWHAFNSTDLNFGFWHFTDLSHFQTQNIRENTASSTETIRRPQLHNSIDYKDFCHRDSLHRLPRDNISAEHCRTPGKTRRWWSNDSCCRRTFNSCDVLNNPAVWGPENHLD
jgi:hypothetical protein